LAFSFLLQIDEISLQTRVSSKLSEYDRLNYEVRIYSCADIFVGLQATVFNCFFTVSASLDADLI